MFLLIGSLVFVLFLDQFTKWLAVVHLKPLGSIPVIPQIFHLTYVENSGIAFGFFRNHPELLTIVITVSLFILLIYTQFFTGANRLRKIAYGFILGGAFGNLVDRYRIQHVIDFLDFRVWPVFNVADSFITIGVILFVWFSLKGSDHAS